MQKPSLGRIVLTHVEPTLNNGERVAPAIITRVHSHALVNLRVFCDGHAVLHLTSVELVGAELRTDRYACCWWPPRVE